MQLCDWQSARDLPLFEQLVCPGPVPYNREYFYIVFSSFYLSVCLDKLDTASEQTPAQTFCNGKDTK